jgi:hypothetical protein
MPLVVSDANIFVDIEVAGLTKAIFQLPEQFAVPNILYEEELRAHHPDLPGYGLVILDISAEYVREADMNKRGRRQRKVILICLSPH